jgi:hypothetical protein
LFPGSDCCFSNVEERSEHALTGAILGPNPHDILCGELRTLIKAERIELTHREVVHVTGIVQPLGGPMYALEDFAHGIVTSMIPPSRTVLDKAAPLNVMSAQATRKPHLALFHGAAPRSGSDRFHYRAKAPSWYAPSRSRPETAQMGRIGTGNRG